jgi:hypothetical protein
LTNLTAESTINSSNLPVGLTKGADMTSQTPGRIILSIVITLLLTGLLAACQTSTPTATPTPKPLHRPVPGSTTVVPLPIGDGGLLSKEPCGPPCFLGVVPDTTTYDEAIQILTDYQYWDDCEEWDTTEVGGTLGIECSDTFLFGLNEDNSYVTRIVYNPQQAITVQDLIDEFGEPAYLNVSVSGYEESIRETTTRLYYPDLKMAIWLEYQKGGSYLLEPTTKIDNVRYLGAEHSARDFRFRRQAWQGYIEYFEK